MKGFKVIGLIILLAVLILSGNAVALTLNYGTPLLIIDGDGDTNTSVNILTSIMNGLTPGYYLNNNPSFITFSTIDLLSFEGGDKVDFALFDATSSKYYSLSGDYKDNSYAVVMDLSVPYDILHAQKPSAAQLGLNEYYANASIAWDLDMNPDTAPDVQIAFAVNGNYDGVAAPVPEPGTLMLLGSGLAGVAFYAKKKKVQRL